MSTIFLSHSSKDRHAAEQLKDRLGQRGYRSIFLDVDGDGGIAAGARWERELYRHLSTCSAVIVMTSEASRTSRWCFAEITHARSQGKRIFPVRIDSSEIEPLLSDVQTIDLNDDSGHERLWRGLREAGLDPADDFGWDPTRPPYPGLNRFEETDAAVYFGRNGEVDQLIDLLGRMRRHGPSRFALILGASGCGKSSLVRAGLVPRLRKDAERWLVVPPFRPMDSPIGELARAIASAFADFERPVDWQSLRERLSGAASQDGREAAMAALADVTRDLTLAAGRREAATVLIIDQLEEVLDREGAEGDALLWLVAGAGKALGGSVLFLATLRSDYLGALQQHPAITSLAFETFPLGPLPAARLPEVIEGPAARAGLRFAPGLVGRLAEDTGSNDALPLLAFTLRELYEECREDGRMTVEAYERLGGLAGSVAKRASEVVGEQLSPKLEDALHASFLSMGKIGEEGQVIRRSARLADLPAEAHELLGRLVENRLLVARGEGDERTLEVAHEALFRVWPKLAAWMRDDREFLLWRRRLQTFLDDWKSGSGALLTGAALAQAEDWGARRASALGAAEREFIDASRRAERSRRRKRRFVLVSVMATLAALSAAALWQGLQAREQAAVVRANAIVMAAQLQVRDGESLLGVLLLKEVAESRLQPIAQRTAGEIRTNARIPIAVIEAPSPILAAALNPDASRIAIGSRDGTVRIVASDGRGKPSVVFPGSKGYTAGTSGFFTSEGIPIKHVEFSPDGSRVLTVADDLVARVWRVEGGGEPDVLRHDHHVISARFSADGKSVLTVSLDGSARVWATGSREPVVMRLYDDDFQRRISADDLRAAFSPDGRFVVTNFVDGFRGRGTVRVWRADGAGSPLVLSGPVGRVLSVAVSSDGLLVAGGFEDGTTRVWKADGSGEPRILQGRQECSVEHLHFGSTAKDLVTYCRHLKDGWAVHVWTLDQQKPPRLLQSRGWSAGHGFTTDGRHVVVTSNDGVRIESLADGGTSLALRQRPIGTDVDVSADGSTVLVVGGGTVDVWRRDPEGNTLPSAIEHAKTSGEPTTACLAPVERSTWLTESARDAQRGYDDCERRYGREPVLKHPALPR